MIREVEFQDLTISIRGHNVGNFCGIATLELAPGNQSANVDIAIYDDNDALFDLLSTDPFQRTIRESLVASFRQLYPDTISEIVESLRWELDRREQYPNGRRVEGQYMAGI